MPEPLGVCYDRWKLITRGRYLKDARLYELDIPKIEDIYRFLPLKMFAMLTCLNISLTKISNRHFLQIICTAVNLEYLNISNCTPLEQSSIFEIKNTVFSRGSQFWQWCVCVRVKMIKLLWAIDTILMQKNCCFYQELLNPFQAVCYSSKQKTDTIQ